MDGNYEQHLANGGCPSLHKNGRWFCQGKLGHYDFSMSRHYTKVMRMRGPVPVEAVTVEWN